MTIANWREATITDLFDAQVQHRPGEIALRFEETDLTYAELDRRGEQLARHLRTLGVGPEIVVGVFFERSLEMIVALLGILKAGGAYLPVHRNEPPDRFRYMLTQAGAEILLTHTALVDEVPKVGVTVVDLDRLVLDTDTMNPERVVPGTHPDNAAYVCYTSGSTGMPKGVVVRHRGVVRLVQDGDYGSLKPNETFLQFCSLRFDPSAFEIWGSLLNGARLVIYTPGPVSLPDLADFLGREQITTLWLTTGLLHRIIDRHLDSLSGLRQLMGGGEALSPMHMNEVHHAYPDLHIVNGYGPTEDTCFTSCFVIDAPVGDSVPIGHQVTDTRLYVLDDNLRPVQEGEWGLLYTAGSGLARGYVGRPGITAERFVPDPFDDGGRMYRIGDVVRWNSAGELEFRGRIDDQVKIDGYRIELGEIAAALSGYPELKEAVVLAREDVTPDRKVLVAYVVPADEQPELVPRLRVYLHERLPRYMHPSVIVVLEELPMTMGNKFDRRALAAPERLPRTVATPYRAPETVAEIILTDLVADSLALSKVGLDDNLFELGGSSLLAIDLLAQARTILGVEIAIGDYFADASVAGLIRLIEQLRPGAAADYGRTSDSPGAP